MTKQLFGWLVFVFLLALGLVIYLHRIGNPSAPFYMQILTSFGTLTAVLVALFSDFLKNLLDPVRLSIADPVFHNNVEDLVNFNGKDIPCYFHHLKVINETPHRAVINCSVWLKRIEVLDSSRTWNEPVKFAVPRLMEWAPSEISPIQRSFSTTQIFDFGRTLGENNGFLVNIHPKQGGKFNKLFAASKTVRFHFYLTADNYQSDQQFCFEVEVPAIAFTHSVLPSKITYIPHPKKRDTAAVSAK